MIAVIFQNKRSNMFENNIFLRGARMRSLSILIILSSPKEYVFQYNTGVPGSI